MQLDPKLTQLGFALQAAIDVTAPSLDLPEAALAYSHLLVFGHAGKIFWNEAAHAFADSSNPVDQYSIDCVRDYLSRSNISEFEMIYPADVIALDLRQIGEYLGWQFESPLGIGIHPEFGLWFGYRVVVAANADLPFTAPLRASHPCENCLGKPCIKACPAGAVGESFNLAACTTRRIKPGSECAMQCTARLACPVGEQHRYEEAQINYHAGVSLAFIKRSS